MKNKFKYNAVLDEKLKEEIKKNFSDLHTDGIASGRRKFVITNKVSHDMLLQHTMEIKNAIGLIDWLIEKRKCTEEEKINLIKMLKSLDWENFNLAVMIIQTKQDGVTIHRRKS